MAATTYNRAVSQYVADTTSDLFIRDVSKFTELIKRTDYPSFASIKTGPPLPRPMLKDEWGIRDLPPVNDTIPGGIDASTPTVTPGNIGFYQVGHVVITPSGEKLLVTAVGASNLTVLRGQFGTTGAIVAATAGIRIIGIALAENAESPLGPVTQGELDYNYFQIFDKMIQVSNRAEHTPTYEMDNRLQEWLKTILNIEMPQLMEQTNLWGTRSLGSTTAPSTMGGLFQSSFNGNSVDMLGDIFTEYQLLEGMQKAYVQVGAANVGKTMMMHPFYARIMGTWYQNARRTQMGDMKINNRINEFESDFGTVKVMLNHWMTSITDPTLPDGRILITDFDDYQYRPYSADSKWALYKVYEGGWYSRRAIRGDYTLEAPKPEKRVVFTNLSTAAQDYPNFQYPLS